MTDAPLTIQQAERERDRQNNLSKTAKIALQTTSKNSGTMKIKARDHAAAARGLQKYIDEKTKLPQ